MKRNTKIGDVFCIKINESKKKYFQYITNDLTQLNSDVIRVFKQEFPNDITPNLINIVTGEVEFYAHCITKLGLQMSLWECAGNTLEVGAYDHVLFKSTEDYGKKPQVKISENWWVWRINEEQRFVGKLEGENQKAEIGLVINPESIVYRIVHGVYDFPHYPSY